MLGRCCTPLTGTFEGAIDCFGFPPFLPPPPFFFPIFFSPAPSPTSPEGQRCVITEWKQICPYFQCPL